MQLFLVCSWDEEIQGDYVVPSLIFANSGKDAYDIWEHELDPNESYEYVRVWRVPPMQSEPGRVTYWGKWPKNLALAFEKKSPDGAQ